MINLSVVILSYNTKKVTEKCLLSLNKCLEKNKDVNSEIIVVDNASSDGSPERLKQLRQKIKRLKVIYNKKNLGFAKGANQGWCLASGRYILFLNSDVIVKDINFKKLIDYLDKNPEIGVLTVKVILPNGQIDPASHRGFPTVWNSFCYFFKLESLFRPFPFLNKIFGGYHLIHLKLSTIHEVDSVSGAFYLTRKKLLEKVGGFDEDFFMYGEDIDLSFRIKELGYKIIYYPLFSVLHLKHTSGLKKNDKSTKKHFYQAMKIFYTKHYQNVYPFFINWLVNWFIDFKTKHS